MPFDLQTWKTETAKNLQSIGDWLKRRRDRDLPYVAYGALSTAVLYPVVQAGLESAVHTGSPFTSLGTFFGVATAASAVGAGLITNKIQEWVNRADDLREADIEQWVDAEVAENADLRTALDAILQAVEAIPAAETHLSKNDRAAFAETLAEEAQKLGSTITIIGDKNVVANNGGIAIGGDVGGDVIGRGGTKIVNPDPAETARAQFRKTYLKRFALYCNVLPLGAMGGNRGDEDGITLDAVYIALDTKTQEFLKKDDVKKLGDPYWKKMDDDETNIHTLTAIEAATRHKKLALVGDPGSGKSTFVKELAGRLAQVKLGKHPPIEGWHTKLFPLIIILRDITPRLAKLNFSDDELNTDAAQKELVATITNQWHADFTDRYRLGDWAEHFDTILAQEKLLLIFDGLDEVPEKTRLKVNAAVRAVLNAYPNIVRAIVTCRVRSYVGDAELAGFAKHELAPFDKNKIQNFVTHWYDSQTERWGETERDNRKENLRQAVLGKALQELASNPMLLTTMAIIHQQDVGLPDQRVELYDRAVEVLTQKWHTGKNLIIPETVKPLLTDKLKLRRVLQLLAYRLHEQQAAQRGNELQRKDIIDWLEQKAYLGDAGQASDFLDYVDQRAGLLVGRGGEGDKPRLYDFPHRTFQEYLAGCRMVAGRDADIKREYYTRSAEGDFWYLAGQLGAEELKYNRKSEPTLLDLAYQLCPAGVEPHKTEHWRRVFWSGQMAVVLGKDTIETDTDCETDGAVYLARLTPRLVKLLEGGHLTPIERTQAGDVLARLGDPRPGVGCASPLSAGEGKGEREKTPIPDIVWCPISAGKFLMGSKDDIKSFLGSEMPQHPLNLPTYYMSRYPVTNAQFEAFVADGGYTDKWRHCWTVAGWKNKGDRQTPEKYGGVYDLANHPVAMVSWYEAVAYARWLTEKLRKTNEELRVWRDGKFERLDLKRETLTVRLPSEAEWEKAARGVDGRTYPWGDNIDANLLNYDKTGIGTTSAVGAFPGGASPYGCLDLSGNVWEWVSTEWKEKPYPFKVKDEWDAAYLEGKASRVVRGGAFDDNESFARCAVRDWYGPVVRLRIYGFRVMLSPKKQ